MEPPVPTLELTVNGARRRVEADADESLLTALRERLDLTGTKYGCGEGQCGACTVLVDGKAVRSCLTPAANAAGKAVTTIEGLEEDGRLHPLQEAFIEKDALQCGYCTPGMIVEAAALLKRTPNPDDAEIARAMEGHVCRCCAYPRIVQAIRAAAERTRGRARAPRRTRGTARERPARGGRFPRAGARTLRARGPAPLPLRARPPRLHPPPRRPRRARRGAALREPGIGARRPGRGCRDRSRRLAARRRGRQRDRLHRQGRVRPERAHLALPGRGRGAPRPARVDPPRHGRHRPHALRHGHVRQPLDALHGPAAAQGRGRGPRAAERARRQGMERRTRGARASQTARSPTPPRSGRSASARSPRARSSCARSRASSPRRRPSAGPWPAARRPRWTPARSSPAATATRATSAPSLRAVRAALRQGPAAARDRRDARLDRAREHREPGRRRGRDRRRLRRRRVARRSSEAARALASLRPKWNLTPQPEGRELFERLRQAPEAGAREGGRGGGPYVVGSVAEARAKAAHRLEATYTVAYIAHVPLEPRAAVAEWKDGRLTVWTGTQRPFGVRGRAGRGVPHARGPGARDRARHRLGLRRQAHRRVRDRGGAPGAKAAGKPVKVVWTREEEFRWAYFRPAGVIDVKSGADAEGRLARLGVAQLQLRQLGDPDALRSREPAHRVPPGPLAAAPGLVPRPGRDRQPLRARVAHGRAGGGAPARPARVPPAEPQGRALRAVLEAAAERFGWAKARSGAGRGFGIAGGFEKGSYVATCAEVQVDPAGAVKVAAPRRVVRVRRRRQPRPADATRSRAP